MIRDDDGYGNGNCNDDDCDDGNDCGRDDYDDHNDDGEGDSDRGVMIKGRNCSWNKPTKCYSITVSYIIVHEPYGNKNKAWWFYMQHLIMPSLVTNQGYIAHKSE